MNTRIRNLFLLPVLLTGLGLMLAGPVTAQTLTTLYSFTGGSDGAGPQAGLILSGNTLYGTAGAGLYGDGTVFALKTDGTGFSTLYSFTGGSDGVGPQGGVIISSNTLYGTTLGNGPDYGTVFSVNTDGTGFSTLYSFTAGSDGRNPRGALFLSGDTLYGTARDGLYANGTAGDGTVFKINTDGSGFAVLHTFTQIPFDPPYINSDGAAPVGELVLSGNTLYGTAEYGGSSGNGTVFKLNTDGTGFQVLHSFTALTGSNGTNSDGALPTAGLVLSGNSLYGTASTGGTLGFGTVFKINTDGSGFTTLHNFNFWDGNSPWSLLLSANTLYGTAGAGLGEGTVFALKTDGTGFSTLYNFTRGLDGAFSHGDLVLSDNTLYGTASWGGSSDKGTVFSIFIPPQLTLTPSGGNVVLTWPTNYSGFTLQSSTTLDASALWTTNLPPPIIVNDQNVVTNPVSGTQQFFRLSQ